MGMTNQEQHSLERESLLRRGLEPTMVDNLVRIQKRRALQGQQESLEEILYSQDLGHLLENPDYDPMLDD
jgi:hypothetical protein